MSEDLLEKEKEFRRVNRELDERTKKLFEEIDAVVNSRRKKNFLSTAMIGRSSFRPHLNTFHDFYTEPPPSTSSLDIDVNYSREIQVIEQEEDHSTSPAADGEGQPILDGIKDTICSDGFTVNKNHGKNDATIRFLQTKIKMFVNELDTLKDEYKKAKNNCQELEAENKELNESKDKLSSQLNHLKDTVISKLENNIANYQDELQANYTEKNTLKKEIDSLKKEIIGLNQHASNFDIRLNRLLEQNEKFRNTVKQNKIEEKELRIQIRKLQDNERQIIKNLERRNSEILQAFKKQCLLIDNLKKQKAYLEADKQIQLTRDDFQKILDWKPDS